MVREWAKDMVLQDRPVKVDEQKLMKGDRLELARLLFPCPCGLQFPRLKPPDGWLARARRS